MKKRRDFRDDGFTHREQQLKSYMTPAINEITDSAFMQEYQIERKSKRRGGGKREVSLGRVDYWANFKNSCSFLIELKHGWIRYFPEKKSFTVYKSINDRLILAEEQIKAIKDKGYYRYNQNLFSFALLVSPVYIEVNKIKKIQSLKKETANLLKNIEKETKANILGVWSLPKSYLYYRKYEEENTHKKGKQYFPVLCFIGKIKKIEKHQSRTHRLGR